MESSAYGTHSMRRTKAAQIYRKTGNLRAVQLLLGRSKIESTVRYLGIEVDEALSLSEHSAVFASILPSTTREQKRSIVVPFPGPAPFHRRASRAMRKWPCS